MFDTIPLYKGAAAPKPQQGGFICGFCLNLQSCAVWINPILQDMLRHIFQSCILESNEEILELIRKVR